jgi:hypothetical protein
MYIKYNNARSDFEKLESILELKDQVDIDSDRLLLMRNPTKKTASKMYVNCIKLWFQEHGISDENACIAKRYGIKL